MQSLRAEALFQLGRLEESRASLVEMSQSAKSKAGVAMAQNNLALVLEKMGEGHAALQAERTALEASCSDALMMTHLSRNYEILSGNLSLY